MNRELGFGWFSVDFILGIGFILVNAIGNLGDWAEITAPVFIIVAISLLYVGNSSRGPREPERQKVSTDEKIEAN
jgi:hypothetical protein